MRFHKFNTLKKINIEWTKLWFVISATLLCVLFIFSWGFISAKFEYFPYQLISKIAGSVHTINELLTHDVGTERSAHEISAPITQGGVTVNEFRSDENTTILMTLYKGGEFVAQIIDRGGQVIHEWKIPYKEQGMLKAKDTNVPLSKKNVNIHGSYLCENGDLYAIIEFRGLLKLNKNSDVLWTINLPTHHAVTRDSDGSIWTLSREKIYNKEEWIPLVRTPYWDDKVLHISSEGEILTEFSVLDVILDNQYEGILYGGHPGRPTIHHDDPLHVNDIRILTEEKAEHFPEVKAGDIMLSMRTISTILILDRHTLDIKWCMRGPFHRQHCPRVSSDGSLLIFDNRTAYGQNGFKARYLIEPQDLGYSRLLAIDPVRRKIIWQYQGTREEPFYTSIQGWLEEMPNGDLLAVESEGGRVFQLDKDDGHIVWEYINLINDGFVGRITQATPVPRDQFTFLD